MRRWWRAGAGRTGDHSRTDGPRASAGALTIGIVAKVLREPDLVRDPWDTFALIALVTPELGQLNGFRYLGSAPPVPAGGDDVSLHEDLRRLQQATTGPRGEMWEVAVLRVEARSGRFSVDHLYPPDSADWHVSPATYRRIAEAARPRPEHFG